MVDLAYIGGFLCVLGWMAYLEWRDIAPAFLEPPVSAHECIGRGRVALFDLDDIDWDWFPERKAS